MGPEPRSSSITGAADRSLAYTGARARLTVSELHGVPVVLLTHLAAVLENWGPPSRGRYRRQASGHHLWPADAVAVAVDGDAAANHKVDGSHLVDREPVWVAAAHIVAASAAGMGERSRSRT